MIIELKGKIQRAKFEMQLSIEGNTAGKYVTPLLMIPLLKIVLNMVPAK